jgi:cytoskeleton protein RodZ
MNFPCSLIILAPYADKSARRHSIMSTAPASLTVERLPNPTLNLSSLRKQRGLTLEEIACATRIASRYLNAIEAEDFAALPSGVYATSYLRQYARAIGFNEAKLLDEYHSRKAQGTAPVITLQQSSRPKTRLGESMAHWLGHLTPKPRTQHPA